MDTNVFSNASNENQATLSQDTTQNNSDSNATNSVSFDNSNLDLNDWISLKDYANQIGVSYEAVRQQVNKKSDLLGYHIRNIGKTRFIDSEAIAILSKKKNSNKATNLFIDTNETPIQDSIPENKPVTVKDSASTSNLGLNNKSTTQNVIEPVNYSDAATVSVPSSAPSNEYDTYEDINSAINDVERYIPVDVENDMIDERWTVSDYRLRIKQLTERLQNLEHEYGMLKTIFASMSTSEFRSWKKQQKQEWFDLYSINSSQDNY